MAVLGIISRLFGVIRDRILAGEFGAGSELDIYYAAFRIPDLVYNFVIFGAISAAFIPLFTKLVVDDDAVEYGKNKKAWDFLSNVINVFSVMLIIVCGVLFIFARPLMSAITPGFTSIEVTAIVLLTRIMFLSPLLLGISGMIGGVLQVYKRFVIFSLAPIFYNLGIIFGVWWLVPIMGLPGLAWGVALGAGLHLIIQLPALRRLGYQYRTIFNWRDKNLRSVFVLMLPRVLGLMASQVNLIVITIFGSFLASGTITIFNLASNLQYFPISLVGISLAVASFPVLTRKFAQSDDAGFRETLGATFRLILTAIIPISVIFILLKWEIVALVLGTGEFSAQDIALTANALALFSVSLFAQALLPLLARAFYARHNTWLPFIVGLLSAGVNVFLSWLLADAYGVLGLVWAFSSSSIFNFILLFVFLRYHAGNFDDKALISTLFKSLTATAGMAVVVVTSQRVIFELFVLNQLWRIVVATGLLVILAMVVYVGIGWLLNMKELKEIYKKMI